MTICEKCGEQLSYDHGFCSQCGTELPLKCGACGAALVGGAGYCSDCGQPVVDHLVPRPNAQPHRVDESARLESDETESSRVDPELARDIVPAPPAPDDVRPPVRGWLLALCVALTVLYPAATFGNLIVGWSEALRIATDDPAVFQASATVLAAYTLLYGGPAIFGVVAGIRLWMRLDHAPRLVLIFFATCFVGGVLALGVTAAMGLQDSLITGLKEEIRTVVQFAIASMYLLRSKRVAATFPVRR